MSLLRRKLGEILRHMQVLDDVRLHEALKVSKSTSRRLGETLVALKYCTDDDVVKAIAAQQGLAYIDLEKSPDVVDRKNLPLMPQEIIKKYQVIPLGKDGNKLRVLASDASNLALIDDIRFRLKCDIEFSLASPSRIRKMIDKVFDQAAKEIQDLVTSSDTLGVADQAAKSKAEAKAAAQAAKEAEDDEAPVVKLVNQVIADACNARASDIHFEPFEDRVRLRFRIDGVCHERDTIPKRTQSAITARLKIMAGVRVEEKRIPQDGRIKARIGGTVIDFRVSFCPAYHGESIVLRILRSDSAKLGLSKLGMRDDTLAQFRDVISRPNGIFLVTGPTGSGKTTSLYSALQELNRPDKKIITAEDPIEYNFKGINQCQVNETVGMTFQVILKAMLRQAPNIILVGEIRDKEVGEVAIQAALTGHMVFSTLHTNDAPSSMTRLIDMGLKPFLVASSVQAVLAQRLVRVLCDDCKVPDPNPDPHLLALCDIKLSDLGNKKIMMPSGCPNCGGTGFKGRRGIYEIMQMNSEIRELTFKRSPVTALRKAATATGMRNLLGDGKLKILDGNTVPSEVAKIAQVEGVVAH